MMMMLIAMMMMMMIAMMKLIAMMIINDDDVDDDDDEKDVDGKDDCGDDDDDDDDDDDYYVDITTLWSFSLLLLFLFQYHNFRSVFSFIYFFFFFFRFFISIIICVHCCRRRRCRRHHRCHRIIVSVIYLCELFLPHLRKVGLEWRCWRCVFYRRCNLFRAGGGHTNALQYRDVMVITDDDSLQDDVRDDAGRVTSPASRFVRGLRDAGIPVCVLEGSGRVGGSHRVGGSGSGSDGASDSDMTNGSGSGRVVDRAGWERRVADMALSRTDRVTVSGWRCVQGLERRVVVWVDDWGWGVRALDFYSALPAWTRCTTQLIIVNTPDLRHGHRQQRQHPPHPHPAQHRRRDD